MDAPDDNRDIKLYQASADLLPNISRRLDELLTGNPHLGMPSNEYLWVADSQIQKLISLVSNTLGDRRTCADRSASARPVPRMAPIA